MKTLILGAGYGGMAAATALKPTPNLDVLLIDRLPYHTYYTRLHEAAAHGTAVTEPIEPLLSGTGVEFEQAEIAEVDLDAREVRLKDGRVMDFQKLVISLGSTTNFYGIEGLKENATELKEVVHAEALFDWVNRAFTPDYSGSRTIVIGGGGLTGIELVTELAQRSEELSYKFGMPKLKLVVVEAAPVILPIVNEKLRAKSMEILQDYGVEVLTGHKLTKATPDGVTVQGPDGGTREIGAGKIVWTGGIKARDLVKGEMIKFGVGGRIPVDRYLRAQGYPDVFVIGDMASIIPEGGKPVPSTAQHAGQQGRLTAENLMRFMRQEDLVPYEPYTQGEFISLGGLMAAGWMGLPGGYRLALTGAAAHAMKRASEWRWRQSLR
ncbi:NAD(P)/FAD-dependent oxidoreductase [Deinococcus lacus]|uniref:NAD(P)/FAD-dependent oxidoreductase n=1 Tax=Deinococcus lacus TaxID=392561 RepID=A0ABW1YA80_9DEIO